MMIMMVLMMSFWLVVPLLLIGGAVYTYRSRLQFNQTEPAQTSQTPVEILDARYESGELTRKEYEQVRQDLEG